MKITPLDIRKQSFERVFRGYDKDAVDAFLSTISQEWERLLDENRLLHERIERTENDFSKLKALENTLYKTLQTAQATSQEMAVKAQEESNKKVIEANQQAEDALTKARKEANMLRMNAENKARYIIEEAENELKGLERDIKAMDKYRDTLISQLKGYATETLERLQRYEEKSQPIPFEKKAAELQEVLASIPATPALPEATVISEPEPPVEIQEEVIIETPVAEVIAIEQAQVEEPEQPVKTEPATKEEGSFFDKI